MTLLVHQVVFAQTEAGYVLTPLSKLSLTDQDSNLCAIECFFTDLAVTQHTCNMSKWFKEVGQDSVTAMGNDGKHILEISREIK
jgi:hypothetical protein